jgi:hypothetical protein
LSTRVPSGLPSCEISSTDQFMPRADIAERHETVAAAPAPPRTKKRNG